MAPDVHLANKTTTFQTICFDSLKPERSSLTSHLPKIKYVEPTMDCEINELVSRGMCWSMAVVQSTKLVMQRGAQDKSHLTKAISRLSGYQRDC